MHSATQEVINLQRAALAARLQRLLEKVARRCAPVWHSQARVDAVLRSWWGRLPDCRVLYALDARGVQISSNIYSGDARQDLAGQDLSQRPYFCGQHLDRFLLSDVYISQLTGRSCVTALHPVAKPGQHLGSVAADFDLRDIPGCRSPFQHQEMWERIKGDPDLRSHYSCRNRPHTLLDERIDDVLAIAGELMCERGVFHAKLHFSSGQTTLWLMDDPYRYRLHLAHEIIDPSICLIYGKREYPGSAIVRPKDARAVLSRFKALRFADASIYLRSASLNIMNGTVGLSFSTDDTSYLPADAFLHADLRRWPPPRSVDPVGVYVRAIRDGLMPGRGA